MDWSSYSIHRGVWTNWSRGPVFGLTLTLDSRDGELFISFVALFVSIVGTSFWRISCFLIHRTWSSEASQDGIYHQRQAILRNSANGASGIFNLANVIWTWRGTATNPWRRLLPLMTFTLITLCTWGAASAFSSKVSKGTDDEVLIKSSHCGIMTDSLSPGKYFVRKNSTVQQMIPITVAGMSSFSNYAYKCYTESVNPGDCHFYTKKRLNTNVTRNAPCPFRGNICRSQDRNLYIDTGYIDTHHDLGINAPPEQRFQYRQTTHCAPLETDGYKNVFSYSTSNSNNPGFRSSYVEYYYGKSLFHSCYRGLAPCTYQYPTLDVQAAADDMLPQAQWQYSLMGLSAYSRSRTADIRSSDFNPINSLRHDDADVVLFFLAANNIEYMSEINDPWYAAHYIVRRIINGTYPVYWRDEPASPLGCVLRYQICDPSSIGDSTCTALGGELEIEDAFEEHRLRGMSDTRLNILKWYIDTVFRPWSRFQWIARLLGESSLASNYHGLDTDTQTTWPDNQWQFDIEHWHDMTMVSMQDAAVGATVAGLFSPAMGSLIRPPNNTEERALCQSQKIRSLQHSNFSVFGLIIISIIGGLIILLQYAIELLFELVQKRHNLDIYSRMEWGVNGTLQMQRLAHEGIGAGRWAKCDEDVPITVKGERLGALDLEDVKHPKLKAPPRGFDEMLATSVPAEQEGLVRNHERVSYGDALKNGHREASNGERDGQVKNSRSSSDIIENSGRNEPIDDGGVENGPVI